MIESKIYAKSAILLTLIKKQKYNYIFALLLVKNNRQFDFYYFSANILPL